MHLATLLEVLPYKTVYGPDHQEIRSIVHDSRDVAPGDVFVALRETSGRDGHQYIDAAIAAGAVAVVQEPLAPVRPVTTIQVPNTHEAMALLAARYYGHPARRLCMIGVTGTNGKTTVTYLIDAILRAYEKSVGLIGTAGNRFDGRPLPGPQTHTTPYPMHLHALLHAIAEQGGQYAVMETSSHGLALDRVASIRFQRAVFTNLTRDHLDFHPSFEAYLEAKSRLFSTYMDPTGVAVINRDDPAAAHFIAISSAKTLTYGAGPEADLRLEAPAVLTARASTFSVRTPSGEILSFSIPLLGRFNVTNALAAIAAALTLDIPAETIRQGIRTVAVPGRMERVEGGQPFAVLVDYAHTPDALASVLASAREWTRGRLIVVFGCGGDRDRGKRPEMGRIASRVADEVILTSDNPRTESPAAILREIEAGLIPNSRYTTIEDRRAAIHEAIRHAQPDDTVIIAGKGHEPYQIVGTTRIDFDDRVEARRILQALYA